ncbi:MAG: gliding motility-associated C-terminal domain-containing protein, partial [Mucilaginibacter sp.]|nr:gliding motility-associated C-terminal domain-containing protein [Mucilaginibacter sp.]
PQTGITYRWYSSSTSTVVLFTGATYVTDPISVNTNFYVAAYNATGCSSSNRTLVQVVAQAAPVAPVVANGSPVSTCANASATLTVTNAQAGYTYNFYTVATGGTPAFTGTSYVTPSLTATTHYYVEAVNSTGCTSNSRTDVTVTVNQVPAAPVASATGTQICANNTTTLTATGDPGASLKWYTAATGGTALFTGATFTTPVLTANTTYYVEAVGAAGCASLTRTPVAVTVSAIPANPVVTSASVPVCIGSSATLSVSSPQAGIIYRWYSSSTSTVVLFTGANYVTDPINANTNFYVAAYNGTDCSSTNRTMVQVVAQPAPAAPVVANGNPVSTCAGSNATLTVTNPQAGYTYKFYTVALGGSSVFTGTSYVTPNLSATTTYYVEAINSTGCPSAARTTVTVTVNQVPAVPVVTNAGAQICPNNSTTLTATTAGGNTLRWYAAATGGTALFTGASFTTPVLTASTTYYVEAINPGGCTSATRAAVTVKVLSALAAPVVTVQTTTASSITFAYAPVPDATGYEVSTDNGSTFITPSSGTNGLTHTIGGLNPNQSVTIIVRALGNSSCQLSANSNAITGISANPFGDGIFVPNAFTPNGDGNNDMLYVYGTNIKSLTFAVYNQWGEQQFRTTNKSAGWDGTYKGTAQPVGVYVYYVDVTLNSGQVVRKKGTVTLIR